MKHIKLFENFKDDEESKSNLLQFLYSGAESNIDLAMQLGKGLENSIPNFNFLEFLELKFGM